MGSSKAQTVAPLCLLHGYHSPCLCCWQTSPINPATALHTPGSLEAWTLSPRLPLDEAGSLEAGVRPKPP